MFTEHFKKQNEIFKDISLQVNEKSKPDKYVPPLLNFLKEHFPEDFNIKSGSAVDSFGHVVKNIDVLINKKWIPNMAQMLGDLSPVEFIQGSIFVTPHLSIDTLSDSLQKVISFKKLSWKVDEEDAGQLQRKIPSAIFAYDSELSFHQIKDYILNFYKNHDIMHNYELDLLGVVNHSVLIKNWHDAAQKYVSIETKGDSLMLFYILLSEYVFEDNPANMGFSFRDYIQNLPEYNDY